MIQNGRMEELINELKNETKDYRLITTNLLDLFCPKILNWDGCVLIQIRNNLDDLLEKFIPNSIVNDRTQFEATHNHIHLSDISPELDENPNQSLRIALGLIEIWGYKLKAIFPLEKFHLVISHGEFGSVIRFYKIRTNEIPWINVNDINSFREEAILIQEI